MKDCIWYMVKWFSTFALFFLFDCKSSDLATTKHLNTIPDVNKFRTFYDVFHTDSIFQLAHIQFPLEGVPEQNDTNYYTNGFKWKKDEWVMHRALNVHDTLFIREFTVIDSTLIIENIMHTQSPLRLERRFSYNIDWTLIFYSPMRMPIEIN